MSGQRLTFAGGSFGELHRRRFGPVPDLSRLATTDLSEGLLERARAAWQLRTQAELRAVQVLARFLAEVAGAGDPLDVHGGVVGLIEQEIRHTELCAALCQALGAPAELPEPLPLPDSPAFVRAPMPERALATALGVGLAETIAGAFNADVAARCRQPQVREILDGITGSEEGRELAWSYVRRSLPRFDPAMRPAWRDLVRKMLEPHERLAERALRTLPVDRQTLLAWPEPELADLGLSSPERQALVFHHTWTTVLKPRLAELELVP
jgi:hypothetical protein